MDSQRIRILPIDESCNALLNPPYRSPRIVTTTRATSEFLHIVLIILCDTTGVLIHKIIHSQGASSMINKIKIVSICLLLTPAYPALAQPYTTLPPPGVCVFDIDETLTQPGSMAAADTCVKLGFGIGINTGEDKAESTKSMNAIYNGVSQRGHSLDHLHANGKVHFYDFINQFHRQYHGVPNLLEIIGDGTNTLSPTDKNYPAYPGNVNLDDLFQYSGGCKENVTFRCTSYPYKHEGLETIAQFYYPDYQRSIPDSYPTPPASSEKINECIILFDDKDTTIDRYASNIGENTLGNTEQYSQQFRGVHILQPGWLIDTPEHGKETVCKTIQSLPAHCQVEREKIESICRSSL